MSSRKLREKKLNGSLKNNKTQVNGNSRAKKIISERQPFIFELWARGKSYRFMAEEFTREFKEKIDHISIFKFIRDNFEQAKAFRDEFYANIKAIPIANASVRVKELSLMAETLGLKLYEIMTYTPKLWESLKLAGLVNAWKDLLEQIQDEAGDKVQKFKGEGLASQQTNYYLGEKFVNEIGDKIIAETKSQIRSPGNRFTQN